MVSNQFDRVRLTFLWFRLCGLWAWRAGLKFAFWALLPVGAFSAIPMLSHWTEFSVRIAGALLQGAGLLGIVVGVTRTRQQFGLPPLREHFIGQLHQFPRFPSPIVGTASSISSLGRMSSTGTVTIGTAPARDVESRLDALEKDHRELRTTVANQRGETREQFRKHAAELEKEKLDRSHEDERLRLTLHQTATGGLDLAVYGVVALAFANLYCTFPQEIACHAHASACTPSRTSEIQVQPQSNQPKAITPQKAPRGGGASERTCRCTASCRRRAARVTLRAPTTDAPQVGRPRSTRTGLLTFSIADIGNVRLQVRATSGNASLTDLKFLPDKSISVDNR
jgi:hypothetical protein